jgi:hypothetical protein
VSNGLFWPTFILVGSLVIQSFGLVKVRHEADMGIFLTSSAYTLPAINLAKDHATYLLLIGGPECAEQTRQIK